MSYFNAHAHSAFSLADGVALVDDYVAHLAGMGHTHAALTDHATMAAMPSLWKAVKRHNERSDRKMVAVAGIEPYVARFGVGHRTAKADKEAFAATAKAHHLTLLAADEAGYRNLVRLTTRSFGEGFYGRPRIDEEMLAEHSQGVIVLSGCIASVLARAVLDHDEAETHRLLAFYVEHFPGRFFLELQNHGPLQFGQKQYNEELLRLARRHSLPAIATNDSHYCVAGEAKTHRFLLDANKATRNYHSSPYTYVRSHEEMVRAFGDSALLRNTLALAEMVEPYELGTPQSKLPPIVEGNPREELERIARAGLRRRMGGDWPEEYERRLAYELDVISRIGERLEQPFEHYMMMIAKITREARRRDIMHGARGSAAGSLLCWALHITDIDPIPPGLYFERFLNVDRNEMPDIDLDFADDRRDEILEYMKEEYGADRVARIGTYMSIGAKTALWDAARYLQDEKLISRTAEEVVRELNALIPYSQHALTLEEVLAMPGSPLKARVESDPEASLVMERAIRFAGRYKSSSVHAGGVVVADRPVSEIVPLMRMAPDKAAEEAIPDRTQYEMGDLEKLGLLKIDILGLKELTKIRHTVDLVRQRHGVEVDVDALPQDDPAAWDVVCRALTNGLFQLGGPGMTDGIAQLQPRSIAELTLMISVYRPGPMEHKDTILRRKRGEEAIASIHPRVDPLLAETWGFPVYQEQVMQILMLLAGYSASEADNARKAIGKKDLELMAHHEARMRDGARAQGLSEAEIEMLWALIEPFAGYGFNKAHAWSYAVLAYKGAWLKAHYPQEFYAACLTVEGRTKSGNGDSQSRIALTALEAREMGIELLPPDVNDPCATFEPRGANQIRYGLSAVKDIGSGAEAVAKGAPYADLYDFMLRCEANAKVIKVLAAVGALPFGERNEVIARIGRDLQPRSKLNPKPHKGESQAQAKQRGLAWVTAELEAGRRRPIAFRPMSRIETIWTEVDALGYAFTSFPPIEGVYRSCPVAALPEHQGQLVTLVGMLSELKAFVTKSSRKTMANGALLDESGQVSLVLFPHTWARAGDWAKEGMMVGVSGRLEARPGADELPLSALSLKVDRIWPLALTRTDLAEEGESGEDPGKEPPCSPSSGGDADIAAASGNPS